MKRGTSKVVIVAAVSALCGCAGMAREARQAPIERLEKHGVSAPALTVEAGTMLQFVNADERPHQIYSNDCGELSSTLLHPGASYGAEIRSGTRRCHFQDLLAPLSPEYSGVIEVHDERTERRLEDQE